MTKIERMRKVAARLNTERANAELGFKRRKGLIVGFTPCTKSLFYLAALCAPGECRAPALETPDLTDINTDTVTLVIHNRAMQTICECHPHLTAEELLDYEYS